MPRQRLIRRLHRLDGGLRLTVACLCLLVAWAPRAGTAQPLDLSFLDLEPVVRGLARPVATTHAGDSRLFLTLQGGQIVIVEDGELRPQPFLDITNLIRSDGERGLLSVAFHPDYAQNGWFFVNYTNLQGDTVIARYRVSNDPNRADPTSGVILMTIDQPFSNHNGGQLQFGPDGFLYIAMGDGGSANDPFCFAQREDTLLGKMLRIDVDQNTGQLPFFGIPPGNPFVGGGGLADEVWATGLRNPFRFSFDRMTGDLLMGDVGQGAREEINFQPASSPGGENYGWKVMEGTLCLGSMDGCPTPVPGCNAPAYTPPILEYDHSAGDCAVIAGYVYRGTQIPPLVGVYLYGDFCTGRLWAGVRNGNSWTAQSLSQGDGPGLVVPGLTNFGEAVDGEIYLAAQDTLYVLTGPPVATPGMLQFSSSVSTVDEDDGVATVTVRRTGGSDGAVSVDYETRDGTAQAGEDYAATSGTLFWPDADNTNRSFAIPILDDALPEDDEVVELALSRPTGGAALGNRRTAELRILDDDEEEPPPPDPCVPGATTLCLNDGRFRVEIAWEDFDFDQGPGQAELLTDDSGYFWFFSPANVEVLVKVIDACADPFERFWVFAAGLTNVETTLTVVDTQSNQVEQYQNPKGQAFLPVQDTQSFATCP